MTDEAQGTYRAAIDRGLSHAEAAEEAWPSPGIGEPNLSQPIIGGPALNVLFDGPPGAVAGRFIEVETDNGHSINAGEWIERPDGTWALRIEPVAAYFVQHVDGIEQGIISLDAGAIVVDELYEGTATIQIFHTRRLAERWLEQKAMAESLSVLDDEDTDVPEGIDVVAGSVDDIFEPDMDALRRGVTPPE